MTMDLEAIKAEMSANRRICDAKHHSGSNSADIDGLIQAKMDELTEALNNNFDDMLGAKLNDYAKADDLKDL